MSKFLAMSAADVRAMPNFDAEYYILLGEWRVKASALGTLKDDEMTLRKLLCDLTFTAPKEGSNVHAFGAGKKVPKWTMTHVITRKVDPDAINACLEVLRTTIGPAADETVRWKPELAIKAYKALTGEQQALLAPAITTAEGSPQLKYTQPDED